MTNTIKPDTSAKDEASVCNIYDETEQQENHEEANVTLLTAKIALNKSYYLENGALKKENKGNAKYFSSQTGRFMSIHDIWGTLKNICKDPEKAIIRGISDPETRQDTRRTKEIFKESQKGACWAMFDIDNLGIGKKSPITPKSVEYVIQNHLPKEFHDVTYVYQFSNSAGFHEYKNGKKGMNVHLYFYFDRDVLNDELKKWLKKYPVDKSLFCPIQIHYTALPDIKGLKCKVKKRQALVKKENDTVKVPVIELGPINPVTKRYKKETGKQPTWNTKTKDVQIFRDIVDKVLEDQGLEFAISEELEEGSKLKGTCPFSSLHSMDEPDDDIFNVFITNKGRLYADCYHDSCQKSIKQLTAMLNEEWKARDSQAYYDQSGRVDLQTAEQELKSDTKDFYENPRDKICKADCSIGKTEENIENIGQFIDDNKTVHYLVPQHKLSDELHKRIQKRHKDLKIVVIKGRSQDGMCLSNISVGKNPDGTKKKLVDELSRKGKSVFESLCCTTNRDPLNPNNVTHCEHYFECPYIQQFIEARDASLVIRTHDALVIDDPKPLQLPVPDILIIDEGFLLKFYQEDFIRLSHLKYFPNSYGDDSDHDFKILRHVSDALYHQEPILKYLRDKGITKKMVKKEKNEMAKLHRKQSFCSIKSDMSPESKVRKARNLEKYPPFYQLLKCLYIEFNKKRDFCHSIMYKDSMTIFLQSRKEQKNYKSVPTFIIDADADQILIEKCLGKKFSFKEIKVKMKGSTKVIQCDTSSFPTSRILPVDKEGFEEAFEKHNKHSEAIIKEIVKLIREKSKGGKLVLVVSPQKVEELLASQRLPKSCDLIHFNNYRGLDKYSGYDVVIVIGRNQMKVPDLERMGRGLFFDDDSELVLTEDGFLPKERRRYSTKDTMKSKSVQVQYHPDERIDSILKQKRESESVQGCFRIRPLRGQPKEIILYCDIPLDLEVDAFFDWKPFNVKETILEKMTKNINFNTDVIPFTKDYFISNYKRIWTSRSQFDSDLRRSSVNIQSLLMYIVNMNTALNISAFKLSSRQNRYLPVLSPLVFSETKTKLEEIYGEEVKLKPFVNTESVDAQEESKEVDAIVTNAEKPDTPETKETIHQPAEVSFDKAG